MGYYIIRQEEDFTIESNNHILRIYSDIKGNIKLTKTKKGKGVVQHVKV